MKEMDAGPLKEYLKREGATLVGVGDIAEALAPELNHLNRGIAIAVNRGLNGETIKHLTRLSRLTEEWLSKRGFRRLSIPPDSDRKKDKFIARLYNLFSHKVAATCAGLGWIGKNGLIINSRYGSKLSWATVLTDAPFEPDTPVTKSQCGDCDLCVTYCPSGAVTGGVWSRGEPLQQMVRYEKCRSLKGARLHFKDKPNCGLCITICPYSRKRRKIEPGPEVREQRALAGSQG